LNNEQKRNIVPISISDGGQIMLSSLYRKSREFICRLVPIFIVVAVLLLSGFGTAQAVAKAAKQKVFKSPEEAVAAFGEALKSNDSKEMLAIFGSEGKDLIFSGDTVADTERQKIVAQMFDEKHQLITPNDQKAVLELGAKNWPLPIPIVKVNGNWRFDTKEGKEEILNRRIGRNELGAIQVCLAYVDAQRDYAAGKSEGGSLSEYAQKLLSEPGKKDGLFWEAKEGEPLSPMGVFVANAMQEGYKKNPGSKPIPYHGYFYRILKAQGKNATGGAYDYVVRDRMIGGFALLAYPAKYGASGIMTFMVNHEGIVYQKNLGPVTESAAQRIKLFDPDKTWKKVE
jgi:hypothetical protein